MKKDSSFTKTVIKTKNKTKTKSKKKKKRQKLFFLRNYLFFTADQDCDNDSTYNGMEHNK